MKTHYREVAAEINRANRNKALNRANRNTALPTDSQERKDTPIFSGFMAYFPAAVAEVARLSKAGNDKHNPGEPMHWSRDKSNDHAGCIMRHLLEHGEVDDDGFSHTVKVAWRAMALLQEELEAAGAPLAPAARISSTSSSSWVGSVVSGPEDPNLSGGQNG